MFRQDLYPTLKYMEYETETEASSMVSVSQGICQFNNWNSNQASPSNDDWDSNKTSPSNGNWNSNQKSFSSDVQEKSLNINSSLIIETWPEEETHQWHLCDPKICFYFENVFCFLVSFLSRKRQGQIASLEKKCRLPSFFSFWLDFFGK
jgi:hypothetical protein